MLTCFRNINYATVRSEGIVKSNLLITCIYDLNCFNTKYINMTGNEELVTVNYYLLN